jgi:hypothetical protein
VPLKNLGTPAGVHLKNLGSIFHSVAFLIASCHADGLHS